mgnify:CR=1 FL=1
MYTCNYIKFPWLKTNLELNQDNISLLFFRTANREESKYVGSEMCNSKIVKKISFTGSTSVGKLLMEQSSKSIKRISLGKLNIFEY